MRIAPIGVGVRNPAFDVTPHHLITALITEKGIIYPPLSKHCQIGKRRYNKMNDNIITAEEVRELLEFQPGGTLVTSFYLNVDPRHVPSSKFTTLTRNLLRDKQQSLEKEDWPREMLDKVKEDFKKIENFVINHFELKGRVRGLVIIADAARDFFQVYQVAQPVKSQVVVDPRSLYSPSDSNSG